MRFVFRAFHNPAFDGVHLRRRERTEFGLRLRHYLIAIVARNPDHDVALIRLAGHDRAYARPVLDRLLANVESQSGIALLLVRTMAGKAFVRKNWPDVAIEAELLRRYDGKRQKQSCCD